MMAEFALVAISFVWSLSGGLLEHTTLPASLPPERSSRPSDRAHAVAYLQSTQVDFDIKLEYQLLGTVLNRQKACR
jgi:hypothetical protein